MKRSAAAALRGAPSRSCTRSSRHRAVQTSALLALPDGELVDLLSRALGYVELDRASGCLVPALGVRDLARLACTCRHLCRSVAAASDDAHGYSDPFTQKLAHDIIRERELSRGCGRERGGQRVVARGAGETWLHMLHQLDKFDRMPLEFSKCM